MHHERAAHGNSVNDNTVVSAPISRTIPPIIGPLLDWNMVNVSSRTTMFVPKSAQPDMNDVDPSMVTGPSLRTVVSDTLRFTLVLPASAYTPALYTMMFDPLPSTLSAYCIVAHGVFESVHVP
jgi:hypothetical protein